MAIFLAGIANVEIFDGNKLFASGRTLIDSSINIENSFMDVRGGQGDKLIGKYFHTTSFNLKIVQATFDLSYIAANVGSNIIQGGSIFYNENLTASELGDINLTVMAAPHIKGKPIYAWIKKDKIISNNRETKEVVNNKIIGLEPGETYCVRYMYTNASARKIVVSSNFVPDTLTVFLTANLYSGDAANPTTGTKVGSVTIKVPRFLLSGNQELSMTSTGASTTNFEGSALASGGSGCSGSGIYAEIISIKFGTYWYDGVNKIIAEEPEIRISLKDANSLNGYIPIIYALYSNENYAPKLISNDILKIQESHLSKNEKSKLLFSINSKNGLYINEETGKITTIMPTLGESVITIKLVKESNLNSQGNIIEGNDFNFNTYIDGNDDEQNIYIDGNDEMNSYELINNLTTTIKITIY